MRSTEVVVCHLKKYDEENVSIARRFTSKEFNMYCQMNFLLRRNGRNIPDDILIYYLMHFVCTNVEYDLSFPSEYFGLRCIWRCGCEEVLISTPILWEAGLWTDIQILSVGFDQILVPEFD